MQMQNNNITTETQKSSEYTKDKQTVLGEYLYLGMGTCNGHKVVLSVGYTQEYAHKKALEHETAGNGSVTYEDISVVKVGDKTKCDTIKYDK